MVWLGTGDRRPSQSGRLASVQQSKSDLIIRFRASRLIGASSDETQLTRLQQMGMNQIEEGKLLALRDYILKLAYATAR